MELNDSPQPHKASRGLGEPGKAAQGRRVGVGVGKSLGGRTGILCSHFSTCILFRLSGKNERKKEKFPDLDGSTRAQASFKLCLSLRSPLRLCPGSQWQGLTLTRSPPPSAPPLFHKAGQLHTAFFKERRGR